MKCTSFFNFFLTVMCRLYSLKLLDEKRIGISVVKAISLHFFQIIVKYISCKLVIFLHTKKNKKQFIPSDKLKGGIPVWQISWSNVTFVNKDESSRHGYFWQNTRLLNTENFGGKRNRNTNSMQLLAKTLPNHRLVSQCHPGYWSRVLGLEWIDILTNNFRQHERLNV